MRRFTIVPAALALPLLLGGAATAAASTVPGEPGPSGTGDPEAEARVEAGLAALDEVAADAGFIGDGIVTPIVDPVGIGDDPDPAFDCFADFAGTVAEDGTFTGQVAGSASPTYYQTDGDTVPEDGSEFELDQIDGAAAILEADALPAFSAMVEAFGTDELGECLAEAIGRLEEESDVEDLSFDIEAESLDIGDVSSMMTITLDGSFGGQQNTATTAFGMAVADDAVAVVTVTAQSDELDTGVVGDSLEAMIDAMSA